MGAAGAWPFMAPGLMQVGVRPCSKGKLRRIRSQKEDIVSSDVKQEGIDCMGKSIEGFCIIPYSDDAPGGMREVG